MTHLVEQLDSKGQGSDPRAALENLSKNLSEKGGGVAAKLQETGREFLKSILDTQTELGRFFEKGLQILISLGILGEEEKKDKSEAPKTNSTHTSPSPNQLAKNSTFASAMPTNQPEGSTKPKAKEKPEKEGKEVPRRTYFLMNMRAIQSGIDGKGMNRFGRKLAEEKIILPPLITEKNGYKTIFGDQAPPKIYEEFENIVVSKLQPNLGINEKSILNTAKIMQYFAIGRYQILPVYSFQKIGLNPESLRDIFKFMNTPHLQEKVFRQIITDSIEKYAKPGATEEEIIKKVAISYYAGPKAAEKYPQSKSALSKSQYGGGSILSYADSAFQKTMSYRAQGSHLADALARAITNIESSS